MKEHMESARAKLGELGALASQNEAMERKIRKQAESMLADVEKQIDGARSASLTGGEEAADKYTDLVSERGRLHMVIAQAKQALSDS